MAVQKSAEADGFAAQVPADVSVGQAGIIPFVEEQVDYGAHGFQTRADGFALQFGRLPVEFAQPILGPREALLDVRFGCQQGRSDFADAEAAKRFQRHGHLRFRWQFRIATDEEHPELVVRKLVVEADFDREIRSARRGDLLADGDPAPVAPEGIDRGVLGYAVEPAGGIFRNAAQRPRLQCLREGRLDDILHQVEILEAEGPGQQRDYPTVFAAEEVVDQSLRRLHVPDYSFTRLKTLNVWPEPALDANSVGRSLPTSATQLVSVSPSSL